MLGHKYHTIFLARRRMSKYANGITPHSSESQIRFSWYSIAKKSCYNWDTRDHIAYTSVCTAQRTNDWDNV